MAAAPKPSLCRVCKEYCGILAEHDGKRTIIKGNPDHPISKGFICPRGAHYGEVHDSPERLDRPLLRKKSGFEPISMEDALDILAQKLERTAKEHGPESLGFYKGEALKHFEVTDFMKHFSYALGSPNYYSVSSICHYALNLAQSLTYGGIPAPDFKSLRSLLLWGVNPAVTSPRNFPRLKGVREKGAPLVVVDPTNTKTAKEADLHLAVKPGRDGFLALAFLKHAADAGIEPPPERSVGWGGMRAMLDGLDTNDLLVRCGIDRGQFDQAAELLLGNRPTHVIPGLGLELQPHGVQTIRIVACLHALLNPALRPTRGWGRLGPLPGAENYPGRPLAVGAEEAPIYTRRVDEAQGMYMPDAVLKGKPYPVKALFAAGGDPMMTNPDPELQAKMLDSLDFVAVFDLFLTPTARRADLVIPAADTLNWMELHDYGGLGFQRLGLIQPALDSGKGVSIFEVILGLARRTGLEGYFPWANYRDALRERLAHGGVDLADLENSPSSTLAYPDPETDGEVVFNFLSCEVEATGPAGIPNPEELAPPADTGGEYPFLLCTGDRLPGYQHAQFRNIPSLRRMAPEPVVLAHPDAAASLGIADGEMVSLATAGGQITLQLKLSDSMRKDCLGMTHGWEKANANILCSATRLDPISGFPWLRCLPARLEPAA